MLALSVSMVRAILTSFLWSLNLGSFLLPAQAQVVSDETLDSQVNPVDEHQLVITGGKEAGTNLFHSFSQFSVPSHLSVHFNNRANIENIFSRITGGSISNIDGLIKANNASLFLLNPAGIIFGPNAQLDLGGSFIATTAQSIVFTDGIEFSATNTNAEPLLTINVPIGLQYGTSPGAIISKGVLVPTLSDEETVQQIENPTLITSPGNTIALVGGEVSLESTGLVTITGRTEIGSVAGGEFVALESKDNGWGVNYEGVEQFGQIALSRSRINSSEGGSVQIRGKDIQFSEVLINNFTSHKLDGKNIELIATDLITLDNSFLFTQVGAENSIPDEPIPIITGDGGDISLKGNQIFLSSGSAIDAGTTSAGDGGDITLNAQDSVELAGKNETNSATSFISTATAGSGAGGKIEINTGNLSIQDGGRIVANSLGEGEAGTISVNAADSIEVVGTDVTLNNPLTGEEILLPTGFFATTASGTGGNINLKADSILLAEQGTISATAENKGDGGNINIDTNTLVLLDKSVITANANRGKGGDINVITQGLFIAPDAEITASSQFGVDGIVEIVTPDINSEINTMAVDRSILVKENLIYTGCSLAKDFIDNQFNSIGRGGLPFNPLEELTIEDTMVDLGKIEPPETEASINWSNYPVEQERNDEIKEANSWIINQKGNIELIASNSEEVSASTSICQFKS